MEEIIRFYHVFKRFGSKEALHNINLVVGKGEYVFVTGPSGAGKTTLLRIMFGMERASEGQVLIKGINMNRIRSSRLSLLRREMGFVFQDFKLLNNRTVFQNISLALEIRGERRATIKKKTRQILRAVGLQGKENDYPLQLSGGEQQRVAIARAIINEPVILLADEPTGNLDPELSREIIGLFERINNMGTTVVIATHDKQLISSTEKRIIFLREGRLIEEV